MDNGTALEKAAKELVNVALKETAAGAFSGEVVAELQSIHGAIDKVRTDRSSAEELTKLAQAILQAVQKSEETVQKLEASAARSSKIQSLQFALANAGKVAVTDMFNFEFSINGYRATRRSYGYQENVRLLLEDILKWFLRDEGVYLCRYDVPPGYDSKPTQNLSLNKQFQDEIVVAIHSLTGQKPSIRGAGPEGKLAIFWK